MGARLAYAKVVDRQRFYMEGAKIHPGLDNGVLLDGEPGKAGAFLVLRGWTDDHGTFTEQWRIQEPDGRTIYESLPRELHLPTTSHTERIEDEVADLDLDFASDGYNVIFFLDEVEVARTRFPVRAQNQDGA